MIATKLTVLNPKRSLLEDKKLSDEKIVIAGIAGGLVGAGLLWLLTRTPPVLDIKPLEPLTIPAHRDATGKLHNAVFYNRDGSGAGLNTFCEDERKVDPYGPALLGG